MKYLIIALLASFALACTAPDATKETLRKSGYKDIQTGGYNVFACGRDDNFATEFTATNPAGERVSGVVCCGLWKNCTVRF